MLNVMLILMMADSLAYGFIWDRYDEKEEAI
jgi:hypothetical protein